MKTILVTGSAGFIGFHTALRLLTEGYTVIGVDNFNTYYDPQLKKDRNSLLENYSNYTHYLGDISDISCIEMIFSKHRIDKVCHLAAQAGVRYSLDNPFVYIESNINGFLNILETARKNNCTDIVFASSSSVYGKNEMPTEGFSEQDRTEQQISMYGVTKKSNELMAQTYNHLYGMNCTGLRFFTVYGPWGRPDMAPFKFAYAIAHQKKMDVYNHGKMKRDFTYIDDIVDGVIAALQNPFPFEIFNLGNSNTVDLGYFIAQLEKQLEKKAIIEYLPLQPGDIIETFANINKAEEKLNFKPQIQIEEGCEKFIQWYKEYYHI